MLLDDEYIKAFYEPTISRNNIALPKLNYITNSKLRAKYFFSFVLSYNGTRDIIYISICFSPFEAKINLFHRS